MGKPLFEENGKMSKHKANPPIKARVFTITPREVKESNEMATCLLNILDQLSLTLILDIVCFELAFTVIMPYGDCLNTDRKYVVNINIQGIQLNIELIII